MAYRQARWVQNDEIFLLNRKLSAAISFIGPASTEEKFFKFRDVLVSINARFYEDLRNRDTLCGPQTISNIPPKLIVCFHGSAN